MIFRLELPFFKPEREASECAQLGICLEEFGYTYNALDITNSEITFWKNFKDALILHETDFIKEGTKDLFDSHLQEADFMLVGATKGRLYRNLYIVKNEVITMKCNVKLVWDSDANVWITESADIPGLLLESPSFDTLIERVRIAAPEMLELNRGYVGQVSLIFEAERIETAMVS